jgi:ribose-phosphate pyrophosphokinase
MPKDKSWALFSGTSHKEFSEKVAKELGKPLGNIEIKKFPDGEIGVRILENVRGKDVFVIETTAKNPNLYLMELLIIVDALKRASARSICVVIPYFGYARQDRRAQSREPISARLIANLLERAGVDHILTMDLHSQQLEGFFDIPLDNLYAKPLLVGVIKKEKLQDLVIVAPDVGRSKMARSFAEDLLADVAIVDKDRISAIEVKPHALIGDVKNKNVILIDDICSTGQTLLAASKMCKKYGAKKVFAAVSHALFDNKIFEKSDIEKIWITDSAKNKEDRFVKIVSVSSLFARAIKCVIEDESISSLYN